MSAAELLIDARNEVGESPVWHPLERALYWVDIPAKTLHRWKDGQTARWTVSEMIGCIAPDSKGGWIAGLETGVFHLDLSADGSVEARLLVPHSHPRDRMRSNDGRCDRQGRFVVSTMYMNMAESLQEGGFYRYAASDSGSPTQVRDLILGLYTPNGLAFSPDGCTLYQSDSHPKSQMIWAWDYDTDHGIVSNRRVFIDMNPMPGRPDGAAVDADGCYWICGNDAGKIYRFTPQGKLDRQFDVPVKKPSMCAFGGDDMKTLFVTTIRPAGVDLTDQPLAGGVFALNPGVSGLPEPFFQP